MLLAIFPYKSREGALVVAVVALAVVRLDVPVRSHDLREHLRAPRVRVQGRDVPGGLLRRLADGLAQVAPALVLLPRLPRLPDVPARPDDRPRAGESGHAASRTRLRRVGQSEGVDHHRIAPLRGQPKRPMSCSGVSAEEPAPSRTSSAIAFFSLCSSTTRSSTVSDAMRR